VAQSEIVRRASYGPTSPVVGERGARTRGQIIEVTLSLFAQHGVHATLVDDIAKSAGISRATLYQYFSSKEDLFRIAQDTNQEFGRVINVVKAAEMLDLVDTPKRMVELTPPGSHFVKASLADRHELWKKQLGSIRLFTDVSEMLEHAPGHVLDRDVVLETIALRLPSEDYEKTFETLVRWGRYGHLLAYDDDTELVSRAIPASVAPPP